MEEKKITFEDIKKANDSIQTTDIKGKEYAEVNQRIKAFRMVYPQGGLPTEIISLENGIVIMKCTVLDEQGKVLATGTAYEKEGSTFINKTSYIENCETSAVGRALGMAGFGIDTSVASYEEVQNAITQQEAGKQIITEQQADMLMHLMSTRGITADIAKETLQKNYGVDTAYKLTLDQYGQIMRNLNK